MIWIFQDISLQQYKELLEEIRENCERNTEAKKLAEEESENAGSTDSCSRLSSTKIRKISLTCQLLPPMKPMSVDSVCLNKNNLRTTLPIPNTIPPHVTNTISTPSRNRFLVSRVHEVPLTSVNGITAWNLSLVLNGSPSVSSIPIRLFKIIHLLYVFFFSLFFLKHKTKNYW